MVAIEVLSGILKFPVDCFVQIFEEVDPRELGPLEMRFDVLNEDSEALRSKTELIRRCVFRLRPFQHDPCIGRSHLRSANWLAIAVVLNEAERIAKPSDRCLNIPVVDVRKHRVRRYRAIRDHWLCTPRRRSQENCKFTAWKSQNIEFGFVLYCKKASSGRDGDM